MDAKSTPGGSRRWASLVGRISDRASVVSISRKEVGDRPFALSSPWHMLLGMSLLLLYSVPAWLYMHTGSLLLVFHLPSLLYAYHRAHYTLVLLRWHLGEVMDRTGSWIGYCWSLSWSFVLFSTGRLLHHRRCLYEWSRWRWGIGRGMHLLIECHHDAMRVV